MPVTTPAAGREGTRSRFASFVTNRPIFAIAPYIVVGVMVTLYISWQHQLDLERETAVRAAASYSYAVSSIRKFYSDQIVPRAKEAGVAVSHDYQMRRGAIPLPATMSIDLGQAMMQDGGGSHYRLYRQTCRPCSPTHAACGKSS